MQKKYDEALTFVLSEKEQIEDATQYIRTDLRKARRNYECKFDSPIDAGTGKRKVFYPLTQQEVDSIAPRFELDPEALTVKTNEPGLERKAMIWEELLKDQFRKMDFKTRIKEQMTTFTNEGTMIAELFWNSEKKRLDFRCHDLKDVFLFPKEPCIEDASMFAIRRRVLPEDVYTNDRYDVEQDELDETSIVQEPLGRGTARTMQYEIGKSDFQTELEYIELYERHGWFPKHFFTGSDRDEEDDDLIEGTITIANPDTKPQCIEISDVNRRANFCEAWYVKRPYLWYGRGIGLALKDYQFLLNKIINRRDDNEDVLHRGMFLKQRGMNIDARQQITGTGIWIEVDNPKQVQQLVTQDITQSSYTGEGNILNAVQRLNGTYEIARGGGSSGSASEAAIKDRNAGTRLGDPQAYLNRLFIKLAAQAMELIRENMSKGAIVKITGRDADLAIFDDFKLQEVNRARADEGLPPVSDAEFKAAMAKFGKERFIKVPSMKFLDGDFTPEIDVDASLIKNKSGIAQLILDGMKIAAQMPNVASSIDFPDLFERWMEINGLRVKRLDPQLAMSAMPTSGGIEGGAGMPAAPDMAGVTMDGGSTNQVMV